MSKPYTFELSSLSHECKVVKVTDLWICQNFPPLHQNTFSIVFQIEFKWYFIFSISSNWKNEEMMKMWLLQRKRYITFCENYYEGGEISYYR